MSGLTVPDLQNLVLVGVVTGSRGLKGELRVKAFTAEPEALFDYGPLTDEQGKGTYKGRITGQGKGQLLVRMDGVGDRTAADAIKGLKLYVTRDALPETEEDEYYYSDLIGLRAELVNGEEMGVIRWVLEAGAGASLEVDTATDTVMVPFTKSVVPVVDIKSGRVVIDPPDGLMGPPPPQTGEDLPQDAVDED